MKLYKFFFKLFGYFTFGERYAKDGNYLYSY